MKEDEKSYEDGDNSRGETHALHKEAGNVAYKSGDYRDAISQYTLAIETAKLLPPSKVPNDILATYYSNRAAANTMILKYDDALLDCVAALEIEPAFVKAHVRKAKIQTTLGLLEDAKKSYSLALIRDPNDSKLIKERDSIQTLQRRFDIAKALLQRTDGGNNSSATYLNFPNKRDANQALSQIVIIQKEAAEWEELLLLKVHALVSLGRTEEAYALTTTLIRRNSSGRASSSSASGENSKVGQSSQLILLRAHCLFCMGNVDDAVKHCRQILAGDPDHKCAFTMHKILRNLGKKKEEADKAYKSRDFLQSIKLYSEALDLCPKQSEGGDMYSAKLHFNRASAYANMREHENVVKDCTRAIYYDDEYLKAYLRRATSRTILGGEEKIIEAIKDYEKALTLVNGKVEQEKDIKKKIQAAKVQLKRAKRKDFYKILGVSLDASDAEIKKCYRKAALKWHPDRHSNSSEEEKKEAEKVFRDVNLAYEVLSDPQKKKLYDQGVDENDLDNPDAARHHGGGGGMHGGVDPSVLFQMFMQQQGGMGGGGGGHSFHFG